MVIKSQNLLDYNKEEIEELVKSLGQPKFRAAQLWNWLYKGAEFEEMTNLPETFRRELKEHFTTGRRNREILVQSRRWKFCGKRSDEV